MKIKRDISKSDLKTWEEYTKDPKDIFDKDKKKVFSSLHKRYKFDLHGYTLDEANKKVEEMLLQCIKDNYKELLLITGKGIHSNTEKNVYTSKQLSKLRYSIPEFLKSREEISKCIISVTEADLNDGGEGAILVTLKSL